MHNPKCGGTSIRNVLVRNHDIDPIFASEGRNHHPSLGSIAYAHLSLAMLAEHYPDVLYRVIEYQSYELIRDPQDRFISSLSQRMRMEGGKTAEINTKMYSEFALKICNALSGRSDSFIDHEYIHFEPQVKYFFIDQKQVVKNVFFLDDLSSLLRMLQQNHGIYLNVDDVRARKNKAIAYRSSSVATVAEFMKSIIKILPDNLISESIKNIARNAVYSDIRPRSIWQSLPEEIKDFVFSYYEEDIRFINLVRLGGETS